MGAEIPATVLQRLEQLCQQAGCTLLEARLVGLPGRQRLVLYIDNATGITHRDCQVVTELVFAELADDPFADAFQTLEVSSPGVDRPLQYPWQFPKHIGRRLRCLLQGGTTVEGTLLETSTDAIHLQMRQQDRWIAFTELRAAYVLPQW